MAETTTWERVRWMDSGRARRVILEDPEECTTHGGFKALTGHECNADGSRKKDPWLAAEIISVILRDTITERVPLRLNEKTGRLVRTLKAPA